MAVPQQEENCNVTAGHLLVHVLPDSCQRGAVLCAVDRIRTTSLFGKEPDCRFHWSGTVNSKRC